MQVNTFELTPADLKRIESEGGAVYVVEKTHNNVWEMKFYERTFKRLTGRAPAFACYVKGTPNEIEALRVGLEKGIDLLMEEGYKDIMSHEPQLFIRNPMPETCLFFDKTPVDIGDTGKTYIIV